MEMFSAIKMLLGKAVALAKPKVVDRLKSARAEHVAYRCGEQKQSVGMRVSFEETYQRLVSVISSDSQPSKVFTGIEARIVVPPNLKGVALQDWFTLIDTRDGLFALAEAKVLSGVHDEPAVRKKLAESYAQNTGENEKLAHGTINSVVDALVASYRIRIEDQHLLTIDAVHGQLRVNHAEVLGDIAGVADQMSQIAQRIEDAPSPALEPLSTERVKKQLNVILQTRHFDTEVVKKILALVKEVTAGELRYASHEQKQAVILWTVRILAGHKAPLDEVRHFQALLEIDKRSPPYLVAEALILEAQGQIDDALQLLRDIENDEARSAMLAILIRRSGPAAAVQWKAHRSATLSANSLTPVGWSILAGVLAEEGRWEEAFECFSIARPLYDDFPDLYFIEGMYRAVMLFPREFRLRVLNQNLVYGVAPVEEGDTVEKYRGHAIELLARAESLIGKYSKSRQHHAREARLWLALGSRDDFVREQAMEEARKSLSDARSAVSMYHILRQFKGFTLDSPLLFAYLESRRVEADLSDDEWVNWYFLAIDVLPPSELSKFLDEHNTKLRDCVDTRVLTTAHIAALIADGKQAMRARAVLDANHGAFSSNEAGLLEAQISAVEGADVRPQLEELHQCQPTLNNASALANYLAEVSDFPALEPIAREVYELDRNELHARKLVWCLQNLRDRANEIVQFLRDEIDITHHSLDLQSALARSLLEIGEWRGARDLIERLLAEDPLDEEYVGLEIRLSTKTGDWEHFTSILERTWGNRDRYSVETLLMLAQLAGDGQASRQKAFQLLKLAVERGEGSPRVLLPAYNAAVKLGMESEETASWLTLAASTDTEGLVRNITLRQVVEEVIPSNQRRGATLMESLSKGSMPLQLLAPMLGLPLGRLYYAIPTLNAAQADPRMRAVLPFFSARNGSSNLEVSDGIGLDISAALTLSRLKLLDTAIETFESIRIAANTMEVLLKEVHRVKFHQPSEIRLAEAVVRAFDIGILISIEGEAVPPKWLVDEVGYVLAHALEKARRAGGFVVASHPIFKADSLGEVQANLREYAGRTMTLRTFVASLTLAGKLPAVLAEQADAQLARFDRGEKLDVRADFAQTDVFVDAVAVRYLQQCGVLEGLIASRIVMRTAPLQKSEFEHVIAEASECQRTVEALDATRISLRRGMEIGRVHFLQERILDERNHNVAREKSNDAFTAIAFFQASSHISKMVVDDRYFTRLDVVVGEDGRQITPHSSLDIIDALVGSGKLSEADGLHQRNLLRGAATAYITVRTAELHKFIAACTFGKDGELHETHELRTLRQNLALTCSLETSDPRDRQFLDSAHAAAVSVLLSIWSSSDVGTEEAVAVTEWLLRSIIRPVWTAAATVDGKPNPELGTHFVALSVSLILFQSINWKSEDRRTALHAVIEQAVLVPARRANTELEKFVCNHIARLLSEFRRSAPTAERGEALLGMAIAALPLWLHKRLMSDGTLGEVASLSIGETIQFGNAEPVSLESFYQNALKVISNRPRGLTDPAGYKISTDSDAISLQTQGESAWIKIDLPELSGLLPSENARMHGVIEALALYGPTFPDRTEILSAAAKQPLSQRDFSRLMYERAHGVKAHWARIGRNVAGPISIDVVAPSEIDYYTRLIGPSEENRSVVDYLDEVAIPYRKELIARGNLSEALRLVMFGYFHPSLAVSMLVEPVDDDTLWTTLSSLGQVRDPYSLAALAEMAIRRCYDERFRKLASDTIASICAEGDEQQRLYEPAAQFANLVLSRVQLTENAAAVAPFWKRMVSWIQAGVIVEQYNNSNFDLEKLRNWVQSHITSFSSVAEIQDTYREPTFLAATPTGESCRNNVVRLLTDVLDSVKQAGQDVPGTDQLVALALKLQSEHPAMYFTAGPCATLQDRQKGEMSEGDKAFVQESFKDGPFASIWSSLVSLSHILPVPADSYQTGADQLHVERLEADDPDWSTKTLELQQVAILAVTCEDHKLADTVRDVLLDAAPQATDGKQALILLNGIFLAAGARRELPMRDAWLDHATRIFAQRVRAGAPAQMAAFHLQLFFETAKWQCGPASNAEHLARMAS